MSWTCSTHGFLRLHTNMLLTRVSSIPFFLVLLIVHADSDVMASLVDGMGPEWFVRMFWLNLLLAKMKTEAALVQEPLATTLKDLKARLFSCIEC